MMKSSSSLRLSGGGGGNATGTSRQRFKRCPMCPRAQRDAWLEPARLGTARPGSSWANGGASARPHPSSAALPPPGSAGKGSGGGGEDGAGGGADGQRSQPITSPAPPHNEPGGAANRKSGCGAGAGRREVGEAMIG